MLIGQTCVATVDLPGGSGKRSPSWAFGPPQEDENGVELPDRAQVLSSARFSASLAIFRPAYFQKSLPMACGIDTNAIAIGCHVYAS